MSLGFVRDDLKNNGIKLVLLLGVETLFLSSANNEVAKIFAVFSMLTAIKGSWVVGIPSVVLPMAQLSLIEKLHGCDVEVELKKALISKQDEVIRLYLQASTNRTNWMKISLLCFVVALVALGIAVNE